MNPKAFISYSWSSPTHQNKVRGWVDRLISDGIDTVFDQYDLKHGQDKNSFMEKMVTDASVTHVLVISDRQYTEKANARKPGGVGTESQIISQEVYAKVDQDKFIPIICEYDDNGEAFLPVFIKSRIWIDFSSLEAVNENWETLLRALYGKPLHQKPKLGKAPSYITDDSPAPHNPASSKFATLKQVVLEGRRGIVKYRDDFLQACFEYSNELRVRKAPEDKEYPQKILDDAGKLVPVRNLITDWLLIEGNDATDQFSDSLQKMVEILIEVRSRPKEITQYHEFWFDGHEIFAYETFLYAVAALLKCSAYSTLHELFSSQYRKSESQRMDARDHFTTFESLWGSSGAICPLLSPGPGRVIIHCAGGLIRRQADRQDLPFAAIVEAELLVALAAMVKGRVRWVPQVFAHAPYGMSFPLFGRAAQHKYFKRLLTILGLQVESGDEFRAAINPLIRRTGQEWGEHAMQLSDMYWNAINLEKLDTVA